MGRWKSLGVRGALLTSIFFACGSEGETTPGGGPTVTESDGGKGPVGDLGGPSAPVPELQGCATGTEKAVRLPLDIFIMFDASLSMGHFVATNVSKYQAVSDALNAFAKDKASEGISVGLQFFPLRAAGVPDTCTSNDQCPGATGPCFLSFCNGISPLQICTTKSDCPGASQCVPVKRCSVVRDMVCSTSYNCPPEYGTSVGSCQPSPGICHAGESCVSADYAKAAVSIKPLPDNAAAIASALANKKLEGQTPTSAALEGALDYASAHRKANTSHTVAVVFATDGMPTTCDENIDAIAAIAANGLSAGIETFVIGVFGALDTSAQTNLDKIASRGGSNKAFMVSVDPNATKQFRAALDAIRGTALPCAYDVPVPKSGLPDFDEINVQHTAPDGTQTLYDYAASASACDATKGGWYYDVDPKTGATPTRIVFCPSTCAQTKSLGGQVDVVLGCQTRLPR